MVSTSESHGNDQTRTYDRADSVVFLKTNEPFGGLSNMAGGFPLRVNGFRVLTSEALYQACRFPHLPEVQKLIIEQKSPMTAKMTGKPYRRNSRPDWDQVRVKIMRWCLRVKLAQNWGAFSEILLKTGVRPIVEQSRKDDFWGAKPANEHTLVGMNVLGRLLMELREAVKVEGQESLLRVEPIGIRDFLLGGRPIEAVEAQDGSVAALMANPVEHPSRGDAGGPTSVQASLFDPPAVKEASSSQNQGTNAESAGIADIKPYPAMQDSGVPWLGEVPGHWELRRGKWLFRHRKQVNADRACSNVLSLTLRGVVNNDPENPEGLVPNDYATYQLFRKGDLVFKLIDLENLRTSRVGLVHEDGIMSSAYIRLVQRHDGVQRFFFHQYFDLYQRGIFNQLGAGVRSTLGPKDLLDVPILVPDVPEQAAIVRFLDDADRRIRRSIAAKRKLIALLNEQKQAIVHRAVTRGVDSDVRLKPSGMRWLGEVPEHWAVPKLRWLFRRHGSGTTPAGDAYYNGDVPWVMTGDLTDAVVTQTKRTVTTRAVAEVAALRLYPSGSLVIAMYGATIGRTGVLDMEACTNQACCVLAEPLPAVNVEFVQAIVNIARPHLVMQSYGGGQPNINANIVLALRLPFPPRDEQDRIVRVVAEESSRQEAAMRGAAQEISLLLEFRARLIADVVTGKLDVREAAARLPDEAEELEPLDGAEVPVEGEGSEEAAELDGEAVEVEA